MPYTAQFPDIPLIRHAISIDERRAFFRQNLIHPPASPAKQDLRQVWFAGDHSDVGGSYPETNSGLSTLALRWISCEAANAGLLLDQSKVAAVLGADPRYAPASPTAQIHNSLTPLWWLAEFWPKRCNGANSCAGANKTGLEGHDSLQFGSQAMDRRRRLPSRKRARAYAPGSSVSTAQSLETIHRR